ncbi:MAG: hypothetical protein PQJ61_12075 [Spirochaetales bacterium]|uniref:GGDEF domain-containing protein n=1 Tax=Candidatus Thalassospirochaeta sargassi TaxID=3119039 RepID=A0AAJ1MKA9_9SPIO|nr:hypothetical protein [Spirochaetales bacterium]
MATKGIKLFTALSIIFYVLLIIYLWYAFYSIRNSELDTASDSATFIAGDIDSAYSVDYSFSGGFFSDKIADSFNRYDKLTGIIIYSDEREIQYIKLTDPRLLGDSVAQFDPYSPLPEITPIHPFMKIYTSRLYFADGSVYNSAVIFDLLDRKLFFPVLRNSLIAALVYLLLSIILLATLSESGSTSPRNSVSKNETADSEFHPEDFGPPQDVPALDNYSADASASSNTESSSTPSGMYSERSGLVWEHFLSEKLDAELKRAASFDQDSCLVFLSIVSLSGFIPYRNISELIVEHFAYKDLAFESGDNTFCIIIPEKDIDEGQIEVEKFKKSLISRFPDSSYKIFAGITSRNSRLLSEKRMIQEARAALNKAEAEEDSTTIAFRTDLNKYREYIATTI